MGELGIFRLLQTIIVLALVISLAHISLKFLNKQINKGNRLIKVLERVSVNSNSFLAIVEVCGKYYLMSFTNSDNKILRELNKEEVEPLIEQIQLKQGQEDFTGPLKIDITEKLKKIKKQMKKRKEH